MRWKDYLRISRETRDGMFFCGLCGGWINKQRWAHFKGVHRRRARSGIQESYQPYRVGVSMREVGKKSVVVYVDGLCEPRNPFGVVAYGLVVYKDGARLHQEAKVIGEGVGMSNNVGEYSALVRALEWLTDQGLWGEEILVKSDSQLLVNQMTGLWDCHGGFYVGKYLEARRLASRFGKLGFQWVPREENGEADALSMEAYEGYCRDRGVEPKYRRRRLAAR